MLIGGYESCEPLKYNSTISCLDFDKSEWTSNPLDQLIYNVPSFINAPIVQNKAGKIYILGSRMQNECFELQLGERKLVKKGEIPRTDENEFRIVQTFVLHENDEIDILFTNNFSESLVVKGTESLRKWVNHRASASILSIEAHSSSHRTHGELQILECAKA